MCGIAGTFGPSPLAASSRQACLAAMHLRGPDAAGHWDGAIGDHAVTLLHTRLAIVDLEARSNQPFTKDRFTLCYNGELYNYRELRAELERLGHQFITQSDTEVVIESYRRWGVDSFDRMEGMWAFALADQQSGILLLSRDRFGEKPLYYNWDAASGTLYFASQTSFLWEMDAPRAGMNTAHLRRFLVHGYKSLFKQPESYHTGVQQLPPASYAILKQPARPAASSYWSLSYRPTSISRQDAEAETEQLVRDAIKLRLRSDVPIAFCLSGGIDSTTLAAVSHFDFGQPIHAYSVYDDDPRYDESRNIEIAVQALGCAHHVTHAARDGFLGRMRRLIAYHDAPLATISFYVESFLSEAIGAAGYKVAITGTGADELFTGYYDHYNFWLADRQHDGNFDTLVEDWRKGYGQFVRNPVLSDPLCFVKDASRRDHIYLERNTFNDLMTTPISEDFEEVSFGGDLLHRRLLNEIWHESLPLMLDQNDLIFMQHSIENRTPFLDRKLAEFIFSVPAEHLIWDGFPKWLLRAAGAGKVPDDIRLNRQKQGFNASLNSVLDLKAPATKEWLLDESPIFELVDRGRFATFVANADERNSHSKFLFGFVSAKIFLEAAG